MIYRPVITGTAYLAQTIYAGSVPGRPPGRTRPALSSPPRSARA